MKYRDRSVNENRAFWDYCSAKLPGSDNFSFSISRSTYTCDNVIPTITNFMYFGVQLVGLFSDPDDHKKKKRKKTSDTHIYSSSPQSQIIQRFTKESTSTVFA